MGGGFDEGEGAGEVEAAGAAAAWVEVEDSSAALEGGFVGVAGEDEGDSGGFGVEVKAGEGVDEIDEVAGEGYGFGGGEEGARASLVDVAANGGYGGQGAESIEDCGVSYITGVEDVIGVGDGGEGFGAEEAVGVGEGGDEHGC